MTDPVTRELRERIADAARQRGIAAFRGDYETAYDLTVRMITHFTGLDYHAPPFPPRIYVVGETRWFAGFNRKGEAKYSADPGEVFYPGWWQPEMQRNESRLHGLAREHGLQTTYRTMGHADLLLTQVYHDWLSEPAEEQEREYA